MEKITQVLCSTMDSGRLTKMIFAGKRRKSLEYRKITLRPVTIKGELMYQAEYHYDKNDVYPLSRTTLIFRGV